ncbi:MAG: hypothetical protein ACJAU6_001772 [Alphaproteobacteria bacterium]|jgi:hypothetical protein
MLNIAGRTPEIAFCDRMFLTVLNSNGAAFQKYAPLLLWMAMNGAFRVRRDDHNGKHGGVANENISVNAVREFPFYAADRIIQIKNVEFPIKCRLFSFVKHCNCGTDCGDDIKPMQYVISADHALSRTEF